MLEELEIKRKVFSVVKTLGQRSKKVERKGKFYFYKSFDNDSEGFYEYIDSFNKLKLSGISVPKIYIYDKSTYEVVTEFIEGENVFQVLVKNDLPDEYFEKIFLINWYCRQNKIVVDYDSENFIMSNSKLWYVSMKVQPWDNKKSFEKLSIYKWFYSKDFVESLIQKHIPIDRVRANKSQFEINKKLTQIVILYYR